MAEGHEEINFTPPINEELFVLKSMVSHWDSKFSLGLK